MWGKEPQARYLLHNAKPRIERKGFPTLSKSRVPSPSLPLRTEARAGHRVGFLMGPTFARGCTIHTRKPQASLLMVNTLEGFPLYTY